MPDDPVPGPIAPTKPEAAPSHSDGEPEALARPHERHPHPCQHAYANFRGRILEALTRSRGHRPVNGIQPAARAVFLILDVPARWLMDICDTLISGRGYVAIGTVVAAYLAVFGLIDAKSTQEETRASLERSLFITFVSSGSAASFVAAMKDFGPTQTMRVTEHPSWFRFWDWGRTYQPNMEPMSRWAAWRLDLCNQDAKDCSSDGKARIDLSDAGLNNAKLSYVNMSDADLSDAALSNADLKGANLSNAEMGLADLSYANLSKANLSGADMDLVNLSGATLPAPT